MSNITNEQLNASLKKLIKIYGPDKVGEISYQLLIESIKAIECDVTTDIKHLTIAETWISETLDRLNCVTKENSK